MKGERVIVQTVVVVIEIYELSVLDPTLFDAAT